MFDLGGVTDLQTAKIIAKKLFLNYNNSSTEGTISLNSGSLQSTSM